MAKISVAQLIERFQPRPARMRDQTVEHTFTPERLKRLGILPYRCRVVWMAIEHYFGEGNSSYPSLQTIGEISGFCKNWVRHAVKELEEAGFLGVDSRGKRKSLLYQDRVQELHPNEDGFTIAIRDWTMLQNMEITPKSRVTLLAWHLLGGVPSNRELMEITGLSFGSTGRAVKELRKEGLIQIPAYQNGKRRDGQSGRNPDQEWSLKTSPIEISIPSLSPTPSLSLTKGSSSSLDMSLTINTLDLLETTPDQGSEEAEMARKRLEPDRAADLLLRTCAETWAAKYPGNLFPANRKSWQRAKEIIKVIGFPEACALWVKFLENTDPWLVERMHPLAVWLANPNRGTERWGKKASSRQVPLADAEEVNALAIRKIEEEEARHAAK